MESFQVRSRSTPGRMHTVRIDGDDSDCTCEAASYGNRNCHHVRISRELLERERQLIEANQVSDMKHTDIREQLAAPFPASDIEFRAGATNKDKTKCLALAYLTARAVQERLDDVLGIDGWYDTYRPGPGGGVLCALSIRIDGEWITKEDVADNSDIEPVKGGVSDALKRAAVKFGVGRYLYKLDSVWVPCQERGRSVVIKETPRLPAWALPQGDASKPQTPMAEEFARIEAEAEHEARTGERPLPDMYEAGAASPSGGVDSWTAFWKLAKPLGVTALQVEEAAGKPTKDIKASELAGLIARFEKGEVSVS